MKTEPLTAPEAPFVESSHLRISYWLAGAAVAGVLALVLSLAFTGAAAASLLADPGALVRWGLPAAKMVNNIAVSGVVGGLILALLVFPKHAVDREERHVKQGEAGKTDRDVNPSWRAATSLATISSIAWTVSAVAVFILGYANISGQQVSLDESFSAQLWYYLIDIVNGRAWIIVVCMAAVTTVLLFLTQSLTGLGLTFLWVMASFIPLSLIGHSAGSADHNVATSSLGFHIIGAAVWIGGLLALALSRFDREPNPGRFVKRYSDIAGWAFVLVLASGVINAFVRVGTWEGLTTPYGILVILKSAAIVLLGLIGWLHRRWIIPAFDRDALDGTRSRALFWKLIGVEFVIMAIASGLAVSLSSSAPPVPEGLRDEATPFEILTGKLLPPDPNTVNLMTLWSPDVLWLFICAIAIAVYWFWTVRLWHRGDNWPWYRPVFWTIGFLGMAFVTSGWLTVYSDVLFSFHMLGHMTLSMLIPMFMVIGAPITLAMRALQHRTDGSRGPREWLLAIVHSKYVGFFANPIVSAVNFAGSVIIFYYTPLFGLSMQYHLGHELMNFHFLAAGFFFAQSLIGIDPVPYRLSYPMRLLLLLATMAFHAFFGVALMSGTNLLEASWFSSTGRGWGDSAIVDQQKGGSIAWGVGEFPTLILAVMVSVMWAKQDDKDSKRLDRAADRNNDQDLEEYNQMLAKLAEKSGRGRE